jgi:hypothetical protein
MGALTCTRSLLTIFYGGDNNFLHALTLFSLQNAVHFTTFQYQIQNVCHSIVATHIIIIAGHHQAMSDSC